jgi:hypothetical protein
MSVYTGHAGFEFTGTCGDCGKHVVTQDPELLVGWMQAHACPALDELPGMWENADLVGGATDAIEVEQP